jgi:hypothetical protein
VVKQKDQIIEEVVEQRDTRAAERNAWRATAVEIRNRFASTMDNDQVLEIYDQKKVVALDEIAKEKAARAGKN